jgi:uncharacterized membrane protein
MTAIIKVTCYISILCTAIVLVLSGMKGYGIDIQQKHITLAVNLMYSFFVLATLLILYKEFKDNNKKWLVAFSLPMDVLLLSVILPLFNIRFHPSILFIFDVYILIVFSFYLGATYQSENKELKQQTELHCES